MKRTKPSKLYNTLVYALIGGLVTGVWIWSGRPGGLIVVGLGMFVLGSFYELYKRR